MMGDTNIRFSFIGMIVVAMISTQLLSINIIGETYQYNIGDISRDDIKVPKEIHYKNEQETDMAKKKAAETVPLVFDKDTSILHDRLKQTGLLFKNISITLEQNPPLGTDDLTFQLFSLKSKLPRYMHYNEMVLTQLLRYGKPEYLKKIVYKILIYLYDNNEVGLVAEDFVNPSDIETENISIRIINSTEETPEEISRTVHALDSVESVNKRINKICYSIAPNLPREALNSITTIVRKNIRANLLFNEEETRRRINEKVIAVKPVMGILKRGQSIVREGDTITNEIFNKIKILNKQAASSNIGYMLGLFLLQLVFLVIFGYFILNFREFFISDKETSLTIFSLLVLFMVYTFFINRSRPGIITDFNFVLFLPIPFVTMILAILYNIYLAMLVGVYIIFFTTIICGGGITAIILAFSSAILGVFVNGKVEKRTDIIRGGLILGFMNSIVIVTIGLMKGMPLIHSMRNIHIAFASGLINSILVLGIFPLYESIFSITTRFKLFELADLNAKIFKKMLMDAPGTYNHSLIVSTMSEAACTDIGANHMLARVGAYYHDIGKIEDAGIYIENRVTDPKAKRLSSSEYSRLIIEHVEKGVALARKNGLPETIIQFIKEHHGTSLMTFFYHQALEQAAESDDPEDIIREDFQYPGPKPHSRETAVVMLADSIEAASRTLQNPDHIALEGMVRKIIYNKLNEGELEHSGLSISDLDRIQKAFLRILNGIFHTRIEYPEADKVIELEKRVLENGKSAHGNS
jgi:putative nucleotidyltransferase with HDIG domain